MRCHELVLALLLLSSFIVFLCEASCPGDPPDDCSSGTYAAPCGKKRSGKCCFDCSVDPNEDTGLPMTSADAVVCGVIGSTQPIELACQSTLIDTSVFRLNINDQIEESCIIDWQLEPTTASECSELLEYNAGTNSINIKNHEKRSILCQPVTCEFKAKLGTGCTSQCFNIEADKIQVKIMPIGNMGFTRVVPSLISPEVPITTCQDFDRLQSQLDIVKGVAAQEEEGGGPIEVPDWLSPSAFQVTCTGKPPPDLIINSNEYRSCRNSPTIEVTFQSQCAEINVAEVFTFPTQAPTAFDLLPEAFKPISVFQCKSDVESLLPTPSEASIQFNTTTSDCLGGHRALTYSQKLTFEEFPDNSKLARFEWALEAGQVNPGSQYCDNERETITHEIPIKDNIAPRATNDGVPPLLMTTMEGKPVLFLQCLSQLEINNETGTCAPEIAIEIQDNCDGIYKVCPTQVILDPDQETEEEPSQDQQCVCRDSAKGTLVYRVTDKSGNLLEIDQPFMLRNVVPPYLVDSDFLGESTIHKHCRQHVSKMGPLEAVYRCQGRVSVPVIAEEEEISLDLPMCQHLVNITYKWILDDCCNDPIEIKKTVVVKNDASMHWVSSEIPASELFFQCYNQAPYPMPILTAKSECDNTLIDAEPVLSNPLGLTDEEFRKLKCYNRYHRIWNWEAKDPCGNSINHTQLVTVEDQQGPELIDDFGDHNKFCITPPTNKQLCISNISQRIRSLVKSDNCDGYYNMYSNPKLQIAFGSVKAYDCSTLYDTDCKRLVKSDAQSVYNPEADTLCIRGYRPSAQYARLIVATFNASDSCDNITPVPLEFLVSTPYDDDSYDPDGTPHPCDERIILQMPRIPNKQYDSEIGPIYMKELQIPTRSSASTLDRAFSLVFMTLVVIFCVLRCIG